MVIKPQILYFTLRSTLRSIRVSMIKPAFFLGAGTYEVLCKQHAKFQLYIGKWQPCS